MRIILLGLPGSGKEELARSLASHYEVPVLTLENTLKEIAAEKNELGRLIKEAAFAGKFSDELIMAALRIRLAKPDAVNGYVLEDFPRTTGQAETLDILMRGLRRPINAVLKVNVELDDLMEHLVGQITCQNCGEKYNIYSNPPIVDGMCNVCGERIRRRPDDYEENIANRLRNCEIIMAPLEQHYKGRELLKLVSGNQSARKIFKQSVKLLDALPPVEIPDDDGAPALPTDESLLKALVAPRSSDDQPRRRGRPRRKPIADAKAVVPKKGAQDKSEIIDEKVVAAASGVVAAQKAALASETRKKKSAKTGKKKPVATDAAAEKKVKTAARKKKVEKKQQASSAGKKTTAVEKKSASKKKVAASKAVAKKTASKKKVVAAKKSVTKKKVAASKTVTKKAASKKKVIAKTSVTKKKVAAKKVAVKKKVATKKKVAAKKAVAKKKVATKKAAAKKKVVTTKKPAVKKSPAIKGKGAKKSASKKAVAKKKTGQKSVKKKASRRR